MPEYINKQAILDIIAELHDKRVLNDGEEMMFSEGDVQGLVLSLPDADVAPVRRGMWEGTADGYADEELVYDMWSCSECGFDADGAEEKPSWKFCPNCGARMDEGDA